MADWKEVAGKILDKVDSATTLAAPLLTTTGVGALALPAVKAIKALAGVFGIKDENPTPDAMIQAIQADPQAAIKIQMAMMQFGHEEKMAEIEDRDRARDDKIKELQIDREEMDSARSRQIQHEKATGKTDINLYLLAWLFVAGFFVTYIVMLVLIFKNYFPENIPSAAIYLIGTLNGTLTAGVGAVIQYFFGKTKDSASHVEMLANSIPLEDVGKLMKTLPGEKIGLPSPPGGK